MGLPPIPPKRYFTIGEVGLLCGVKPHVLRYWEQEFSQLNPVKRRGNRRYYQAHEVRLIRQIRRLLYEQGYTIQGARRALLNSSSQDEASELQQLEIEPCPGGELMGQTADRSIQAPDSVISNRELRHKLEVIIELLRLPILP